MIDIREHGLGGSGLKAGDKQALIDITNAALVNDDATRINIINTLNTKLAITLSTSATWVEISNVINNITIGKKYASGTVKSPSSSVSFSREDGSTTNLYAVTVSGLTFKPRVILVIQVTKVGRITTYSEQFITNNSQIEVCYGDGGSMFIRLVNNTYVTDTGFKLPVWLSDTDYNWQAWE